MYQQNDESNKTKKMSYVEKKRTKKVKYWSIPDASFSREQRISQFWILQLFHEVA